MGLKPRVVVPKKEQGEGEEAMGGKNKSNGREKANKGRGGRPFFVSQSVDFYFCISYLRERGEETSEINNSSK